MPKRQPPRPTDAELAILRVLWERGPSTVREVHETLSQNQETGYTTSLKLMQIMTTKGLVTRDERERAHVYSPAVPEAQTLRQVARDLLQRAFGGSAEKLVLYALQARRVSPQELDRIRKLIDELEEGKR